MPLTHVLLAIAISFFTLEQVFDNIPLYFRRFLSSTARLSHLFVRLFSIYIHFLSFLVLHSTAQHAPRSDLCDRPNSPIPYPIPLIAGQLQFTCTFNRYTVYYLICVFVKLLHRLKLVIFILVLLKKSNCGNIFVETL